MENNAYQITNLSAVQERLATVLTEDEMAKCVSGDGERTTALLRVVGRRFLFEFVNTLLVYASDAETLDDLSDTSVVTAKTLANCWGDAFRSNLGGHYDFNQAAIDQIRKYAQTTVVPLLATLINPMLGVETTQIMCSQAK